MKFNQLEIKRKLFHIIAGLLTILLIDLNIINVWVLFFVLVIGFILSIISRKTRIPVISIILDELDRKKDLKTFPGKGPLNFIAGCLIALILFDKGVALASIMILTIGDAVGSLVGIHFGTIKHPLNKKKLIEGTIAGIILSFIGALIFVNYKEALAGAIIGMIVESIEFRLNKNLVINDNITVPLFSGIAITILRFLI